MEAKKTCRDACIDFSQNCNDCIQHSICGWCDDRCVEGDATSPSYTTCVVYNYGNCSVPINCSVYHSCGNCTSQLPCFWCDQPGANTCVLTTQICSGQLTKACSGPTPFDCTASTCESCLLDSRCVWCQNTGCEVGSSSTNCLTTCDAPFATSIGGTTTGGGMTPTLEGAIAGVVGAGFLVLAGFGFFVWYKYYWTKRHYYERLG